MTLRLAAKASGAWTILSCSCRSCSSAKSIEAEITEVKKNFARARLLRVARPSPDRVEPNCRYFGECGGCQYQHIDYAAQLRFKHKQIADLFERVGKIPRPAGSRR